MKRTRIASLLLALLLSCSLWVPHPAKAAAESGILSVAGDNAMLLTDGSLWVTNALGTTYDKLNLVSIAGDGNKGFGLTRDGKRVSWSIVEAPKVDEGTSGVRQVTADGLMLKNDGTVWTDNGPVKELRGILQIASSGNAVAAVSQNGEILYRANPDAPFNVIGNIANPDSVRSVAVVEDRTVLLYDSGETVLYERFNFDERTLKIVPVTLTTEGVHIAYANDKTLFVTLRDGSVWTTGLYQDRYKLTNRIEGVGEAVRTVPVEDGKNAYVQRKDGTWVRYSDGETKDVKAPAVTSVEIHVSNAAPQIGDSIVLNIAEKYSNGALVKLPLSEAKLTIDKPHLLKLQEGGKLKALGVGEATITVASGGAAKSVSVVIGTKTALQYAVLKDNVVYLPLQPVVKALGGTSTYAAASKTFNVQLGENAITLKIGDANAVVNGRKVRLKATPRVENGMAVFPAHLLADTIGAKVAWDAKLKQAKVSLGKASLTVVSTETAALAKKASQGSLAQYIGRTYWVNHFQQWDRFMKVTVADILPDNTGYFSIVFKSASGKTFTTYSMPASNVANLFADSYYFLAYDPYKKYNWPQSVWSQIKAGNVTLGMTKEQVLLAWGTPSSKSAVSGSGTTVETWGYPNFNFVSFANGKVVLVVE
jgi:phage baseplate assembly protein gpV